MPATIMGNTQDNIQISNRNYEYPFKLDLRPSSELHKNIVTKIVRMADESYEVMERRHKAWKKIDETLTAFIPLSEYEKKLKQNFPTRPVSIVVPYSYATLETIMSYMLKAYLSDPIFQYEGAGPEDTIGGKLLELVVQQQTRRFKSALEMHTTIKDSFSHGFGASTLNWKERWGQKSFVEKQALYSNFGTFLGEKDVKVKKDMLRFEGNEVITIDPYRFLPDPNVSIHQVQDMEFVGWIDYQSFYKLLADDQSDESDGSMFNVRYLQDHPYAGQKSKYSLDNSSRIMKKGDNIGNTTKYNTIINMYVTIIPKAWKLPGTVTKSGEYPEKWLFTVANECILLRCQPLGLDHGLYPIATCAPDYDGYSTTPISRIEMESGLQECLNWMFNAHVANVRKAINDMFVVDPSLINMEDLKNPEPGKLIRLRRSAWGKGVDGAVKQFNVTDITRTNMIDAEQIMGMMSRVSGASDSTQGVMLQGRERVTAQEFGGTLQMALSRLERLGTLVSMQYIQDMAYLHAEHTQQLMSQETFVKAIGEWPEVLQAEFQRTYPDGDRGILATPMNVTVDYDIVMKDAAKANADQLSNQFWTQNFQTIGTSEQLMQLFDVQRIFMHMARINGAKNAYDFIRKGAPTGVTQMPTQMVTEQMEAGNLVPIEQMAQAMEG